MLQLKYCYFALICMCSQDFQLNVTREVKLLILGTAVGNYFMFCNETAKGQ